MIPENLLDQILTGVFVVDLTRWSDEPVRKPDRILYTDPVTGRSLVARAPLYLEERVLARNSPQDQASEMAHSAFGRRRQPGLHLPTLPPLPGAAARQIQPS
jgi:hypothetical protein